MNFFLFRRFLNLRYRNYVMTDAQVILEVINRAVLPKNLRQYYADQLLLMVVGSSELNGLPWFTN